MDNQHEKITGYRDLSLELKPHIYNRKLKVEHYKTGAEGLLKGFCLVGKKIYLVVFIAGKMLIQEPKDYQLMETVEDA